MGERGGKRSDAPLGPPLVASTEPSSPFQAAAEPLYVCCVGVCARWSCVDVCIQYILRRGLRITCNYNSLLLSCDVVMHTKAEGNHKGLHVHVCAVQKHKLQVM